jgi:hypothetical protein
MYRDIIHNMGGDKPLQYWEIWYPEAAATGLLVARGMIDPTDQIILHAAPNTVTVIVTDQYGKRLAFGENLMRTADTPMCRLFRSGEAIIREDIWPTQVDYGRLVILPGGEVGTLLEWWNAPDQKEWRWQIEFYNSRR